MILTLVLLGLCTSALGQTVCKDPCHNDDPNHPCHDKKHVLELGDTNFCKSVIDKAYALVMFYDPMCKNCPQSMHDEFEKASCKLNDLGVTLGKVDCKGAGFWTCDHMRVAYYPDIKVFRYGWTGIEYLGPRTADKFIDFMKAVKDVPFGKEYLLDEARFPAEAVRRLGLKKTNVAHVAAANPCNSNHPGPEPVPKH